MAENRRGRPRKNDNALTMVSVRMSQKELNRLKILADEREFNLSQMVRFLINSYYER